MTAPRRSWAVLTLLGGAFFMTILDGTSLLTALPSITADLDLSPTAAAWTVTAYALAFSGPLLLCGRVADLFGRRRMFLTGMGLRTLASLICGLAPNAEVLLAGRTLQGLSAAITAPAALSMVMVTFPDGPARNKALGIWGGLGGLGATAGLLVGGLLTSTVGWLWVFWINLPAGLIVLFAGPRLLDESRAPDGPRRLDVRGGLVATAALVLGVYTITDVGDRGRIDLRTGALVLAAAAATLLFLHLQRRSASPLLPAVLTSSRRLRLGAALLLIAGMAVDGMLVTLTAYTQQTLHWSPAHFGLSGALMTSISIAAGLAAQRLATAVGVRPVLLAGTVALAVACLLLAAATSQPSPGLLVLLALLVFGAGMGATAVSAHITALTGAPPGHPGVVAAVADTCFAIGTALGVALGTTTALATSATQAGTASATGAQGAFLAVSAVAAAGMLAATRLQPALCLHPNNEGSQTSDHGCSGPEAHAAAGTSAQRSVAEHPGRRSS